MPSIQQTSFNGGELSPWISALTNLDKYRSGCERLENFLLTPYGGVRRRAGLEFLGLAKGTSKTRLVPFRYSVSTTFILEFGQEYLRFWSNGNQVMNGGNPVEVSTPYQVSDLDALQFAQAGDLLYIASPDHVPKKLSRLSDTNWVLASFQSNRAAQAPINTNENHRVKVSSLSGDAVLESSHNLFSPDDVGTSIAVSHPESGASQRFQLTQNFTGGGLRVDKSVNIITSGLWTGALILESSNEGLDWVTLRKFTSNKDQNYNVKISLDEQIHIRLRFEHSNHEGGVFVHLQTSSSRTTGYIKINGYENAKRLHGTVSKAFASLAWTSEWSFGAWSKRHGYPAAVGFHEQRLWWAGTREQPATIWASKINAFDNYTLGSKADDSLSFTLAENQQQRIRWMVSQQQLLIGSEASEWVMGSRSSENATSAENFSVKRHGSHGGAAMQALLVNDVGIFLQRGGRKVREMAYNFEKEGFVANDLTLLAEHITKGGVKNMALQQNRDATLWCVTGSGELAAMTYDRGQNVTGWARHCTAGEFESVAVIYGDDEEDEIWVSVKRTLGGEEVRTIERFKPDQWLVLDEGRQDELFFVDCGVFYDGEPTKTITELDHLEGETVQILADGAVMPEQTVTGGQITLEREASKVSVGLPYASILKPMAPDFSDGMSSTHGVERRPYEAVLRLYQSIGFRVSGDDGKTWERAMNRATISNMDTPPSLFNGDLKILVPANAENQAAVTIEQREPLPLCVLSMTSRTAYTGRQQ